jgi:hypothetical protein
VFQDVDPLGAVPVVNYTVTKAPEVNNDLAFKLTKYNAKTYYFAADNEMNMSKLVFKLYYDYVIYLHTPYIALLGLKICILYALIHNCLLIINM